jgi:outer membrane protein assembly factor BamB
VTKTHVLWRVTKSKGVDHLVSPLLVGDRLLLVKSGGLASCFDAGTGKRLWDRQRIGNASQHLASPVCGDGKVYVTGENGVIVVLEAGPGLKVLAKNDMGESCIATPAIADGRLFIRTRTTLFCVGEKSP